MPVPCKKKTKIIHKRRVLSDKKYTPMQDIKILIFVLYSFPHINGNCFMSKRIKKNEYE